MKIKDVDFPGEVLSALRSNRLVIFAGAGVSVGEPANLPNFEKLARELAGGTGLQKEGGESDDRFLGRIKKNGTEIYQETKNILTPDTAWPTSLHFDLLRLFGDVSNVRIVTTNFDLLFEDAAKCVFKEKQPEIFRAPALPLGNDFRGLVHVHGSVVQPKQVILTDSDFGRAYIVERWASRFLVDLFHEFTILFIGYSHNDTIMNYLSSAFAELSPGRRFALIDKEAQRWKSLGITPILYNKKNNHINLYKAVAELREIMNWSILDSKKEIEDIAKNPPPLLEEENDLLKEELEESERVKFFTKNAKLPGWIDWLDKNHYLDNLFNNGEFTNRDQQFSEGLSHNFVIEGADKLQLLIGEHGMHIHPSFFWILGREIASTEENISDELLSRWVYFLLEAMPQRADAMTLEWLAERCNKQKLVEPLLQIFFVLTESRFSVQPDLYPQMEGPSTDRIDINFMTRGRESYYLKEVWDMLKPNIAEIADPTLRKIITQFEEQHNVEVAFGKASRNWNRGSFHRSAIEPHEQDGEWKRGSQQVLIDIARDCLEWLVENKPTIAAGWGDQLIQADSPLLRRLAVHILPKRQDLA